ARWYSEKLGFESSVQGHWVTVWPKGAAWKIHLCQQRKGKLEPGNTGISFYAKDVEGTVKELKKRGVKFETDFTKSEWGSLATLWYLPFGTALSLAQVAVLVRYRRLLKS